MKILGNELYKLVTAPAFLMLLLGLLAVNIYFGLTARPVDVSDLYYREYFEDIKGLSASEAAEKTERLLEEFSFDSFTYDDLMKRYFHAAQLEQAQSVAGYKEYLESIDKAAENMSSVSIFSKNKDGFTYKNIQMTPSAYDPVREIAPVFQPSAGVLLTVENNSSDVLLLFIALAAVSVLIGKEMECNITALLKPLRHYRGRLAAAKITALFTVCAIGGAVVYGTDLIIGAFRFGLGDLSRPVQSLEGFLGCNLPIDVFRLILLAVIIKILTAFLITLIFQRLVTRYGNGLAYGIFIALAAAEIAAYLLISNVSVFSLLGYINLAAFMNSGELFSDYKNLNFFDIPVNLIISSAAALLLGIILWIFLGARAFAKMSISPAKKLKISVPVKSGLKRPFSFALYKTFITHKGAVIILAVLFIQLWGLYTASRGYDIDDGYYLKYCEALKGLDPKQAEEYIQNEEEYLNGLLLSGSLSNDLNGINGFERAREQYEYIKALDSGNKDMFYLTGYQKLMGIKGYENDLLPALIAVLALCIGISPLIAYDSRCRIGYLLFTSKRGYKTYIKHTLLTGIIEAAVISSAVYIPEFIKYLHLYGTEGIFRSVRCLKEWEGAFDIPILAWLILLFLLRTTVLILISLVILRISSICKSVYPAQLLSLAVFAMPVAVYLMGGEFALTICAPLSVNREILEGAWEYCFVLIAAAVGGIYTLMRRSSKL